MKVSMGRAVTRSSQLKILWGITLLSGAVLLSESGAKAGQAAEGAEAEAVAERAEQVASPEREKMQPATMVKEWMAQVEEAEVAEITEITGVQVNATETGLDLVLQTMGNLETPTTSVVGNTLTAEIANAVLTLPEGKTFEQVNPVAGVAQVSVRSLPDSQVRVEVVGTDAPPVAEVSTTATELVFAVTPGARDLAATEEEELEITVTAERQEEDGYRVPNATTATKTDTPLRDIPQSIQVVPKEVIKDQGVVRIGDAARNVSGVTQSVGYGGSIDNFNIRGFDNSANLKNGFREDSFIPFTDSANIEQVEVLKGPASVLYGQIEPGGIINYVTKQPLKEPFYSAEFTVGNRDFYRPSFDITGPLNDSKSLTYRLNAAYENSDSFVDFGFNETFFVSPVLRYEFGENTSLTLEGEYSNLDRNFDRGFNPGVLGRTVFDLPRNRFLGEPTDRHQVTTGRIGYRFEHRFSDNWQLRNAFSFSTADSLRLNTQADFLEADGRTLNRDYRRIDDATRDYSLQTDVIGKFKTGSVKHQLLVGVELTRQEFDFRFQIADSPALDIFNPVYGTAPVPTQFDRDFTVERTTDSLGLYVQDQVTLLPNLKLLAGGRLDFIDFRSQRVSTIPQDETSNDNRNYQAFSPRVGLVYQPIPEVSLYGSYSTSFNPNIFARTIDDQPIEPERGTQYEVRVKTEWLDGKLGATLAAYEITKSNVATPDPRDTEFSIAAGKVKSRGIELDITGKPLPGWNIIASFYLNDAFVSEDNDLPVGNRLVNAPSVGGSLWTTYEIQKGPVQGLGFGAGVFYVGNTEAELPNTFEVPSYVRADATIFYKRDNWRAALNFKNLFDTNYLESSGGSLFPGEPFTVQGTISVNF